jgi:hypothetical protein
MEKRKPDSEHRNWFAFLIIIKKTFLKKSLKVIFIIAGIILLVGITWWQLKKNGIIRHQIEKAVAKGTDSTYYIHYDSSHIDAVAGNAVFYNVVLQSDSLQQQLFINDTSGLPSVVFNVHIAKLSILGVNIPSFLQQKKIEASSIEIYKPVINIIKTGKDEPVSFTAADTLALYEKLTGKFNSIQAGQIKIVNGNIAFSNHKEIPHTTLQGINIDLRNFKIDSTRNYDNLISYFIKDIDASVDSINTKDSKADKLLTFKGVEYNAIARFLKMDHFTQKNITQNKTSIDLKNTRISGISTSAFIKNRQIKADSLTTDGGTIVLHRNKKGKRSNEEIEIDNNFFDEAFVKNIRLGATDLIVYNKADKNAAPLELKNLHFNAGDIDSIYSGTNILKLIGNSNWNLSADGISFNTADKVYKITIGTFLLDNARSQITVKDATIIPNISKDAFVKSLKFQKDYYDLRFNNIKLTGADVRKIITDKQVIAEDASFQPILTIYNDRTVTPDTVSKIGQYPQQLLQKLKTGIYIKTVHINNGNVRYTERGAISEKDGSVFFTKVNGIISNLTNLESYKKKNDVMMVKATCSFLNTAKINTEWSFPLNSLDGVFTIHSTIGAFDGTKLNPVIEPLGLGSIKSGNIKSYVFDMKGNDHKASGTGTLLYDDLKIKLLKATGDNNTLKKKGLLSFVANILIKDKNPSNGNTRKADLSFNRVTTKTFFNLVWKSIFAGAKTSVR